MKMKDIQEKSLDELRKLLVTISNERLSLLLRVANREHNRVTDLRSHRKVIARLQTAITQKERRHKP